MEAISLNDTVKSEFVDLSLSENLHFDGMGVDLRCPIKLATVTAKANSAVRSGRVAH